MKTSSRASDARVYTERESSPHLKPRPPWRWFLGHRTSWGTRLWRRVAADFPWAAWPISCFV